MNSTEWQKIKEIFNEAIDLPADEREKFLEKHDKITLEKVKNLLKANEEANEFIVESAFVDVGFAEEDETDFYVGKQIDDYKILKEIGAGGMGTVYLAVKADETFDKKVAIKLIKRGMDTSAVLKRFVMERKILASLENANIATLVDGGSTDDGLPYLVMEYIEGEPINKFCNLHRFSIEERLELFRKVCAAISYAHQNLVVHRDIKPSNILVTKDGTPKLLDFGIAKLLHPDWSLEVNEATATMFRLMTPEYASPEQMRGLPITTTSDVYSLGVVLYELLSGERPYKIESRLPQEVANVILTQEPIKPSAVTNYKLQITKSEAETLTYDGKQTVGEKPNRKSQIANRKSLRGDLDNIILKALRKEPERRYQSVQEFSEDIRRHLAGLPVTATADTRFYRIGKFIQRHRTGVFASVLMLFIILMATTITTWQAIAAKREQTKTQSRFNQVRQLANTILFEYDDEVAKLPGSTALREKMVKDALRYLDNLSAESGTDVDLQRELAAAYQKVGDVQANLNAASIGNVREALTGFEKALLIRQKLAVENPENAEDLFALAVAYGRVGNNVGNFDETARMENYRRALEIYEHLNQSAPDDTRFSNGLAQGYFDVAYSLKTNRENQSAIEFYRKAIAIWEKLSDSDRANRNYRRNLAQGYKRLGEVFDLDGKYAESIEFYRKSLILDEENLQSAPEDLQAKMDASFSYGAIGYNLMKTGDLKSAAEFLQKTLELRLEVAKNDPKRSRGSLGRAYERLAELADLRGDLPEAAKTFEKAIEIYKDLIASDNADFPLKTSLAQWLEKLGSTYQNLAVKTDNRDLRRQACSQFQTSVQIWEQAAKQKQLSAEQIEAAEKVKEFAARCVKSSE